MGMEGPFNNIPPQQIEEEPKKETSEEPQISEIDKSQSLNINDAQNGVPRNIDALTIRLKDYFYDQSDPSLQKCKEIYLENINNSEEARSLIETYPDYFDYLFYILGERKLNPEDMKVLAHNFRERQGEISINEKDKHDRIVDNPQATDEEYKLGTYAESIESQVRGAVFDLQEKGYFPMESGFLDLVQGSQYIGIAMQEGVNAQDIMDSIVNTSDEDAKKLFKLILKTLSVDAMDKHNRIQIVITPKNKEMSLKDWKTVWYYIAQCIPDIKDSQGKKEINNGLQGVEFREAQDKIKGGKNAWLQSGLAFVDGKVVSMSFQDFKNLEKSSG